MTAANAVCHGYIVIFIVIVIVTVVLQIHSAFFPASPFCMTEFIAYLGANYQLRFYIILSNLFLMDPYSFDIFLCLIFLFFDFFLSITSYFITVCIAIGRKIRYIELPFTYPISL